LDNTTTDLFQKDLYKSSLTWFYLENLWKSIPEEAFKGISLSFYQRLYQPKHRLLDGRRLHGGALQEPAKA